MEWFLYWNGLGALIALWSGLRASRSGGLGFADVVFFICHIPLWPLLLTIDYGDKNGE